MYKKGLLFVFIATIAFRCFAQHAIKPICCEQVHETIPYSALTGLVLFEAENKLSHSFVKAYYQEDIKNPFAEFSGILKLKPQAATTSISSLCTALRPVQASLFTFSVYLKDLKELSNHQAIEYLSLSRKAIPLFQTTRKDAGIDRVHAGEALPMPYTGKGVITGAVDIGTDYTHPSFRTTNGDSSRVLLAWSQIRKSGQSPATYGYGVEYRTNADIQAAGHDSAFGTHGTVVVGAMAASGFGSNGKYAGSAPDSKIIAISSTGNQDNKLLDGLTYFFSEVKKTGKRGVANLSWGSHTGPHDGTSLFDQAIDSLVRAGGIVVGAAGNWGSTPMHLQNTSGATSVSNTTIVKQYDTSYYSLVDIWGTPNSEFKIQVNGVDKNSGKVVRSTRIVSTAASGAFAQYFINGRDTSEIIFFIDRKNKYNNRPNCQLAFFHNHITTNQHITLSISSLNNRVHAWAADNSVFSNITDAGLQLPNTDPGDSRYSVGELGGTSKSIITVGSHVAQSVFRNLTGAQVPFSADSGQVGPFSSRGPTLDGRIKPDLTAPGSQTAPANGFEPHFTPGGAEQNLIAEGSEFTYANRRWYWIHDEATSFAAPVVTGGIALLLEADKQLDYARIKELLISTTTKDIFTGSLPGTGSEKWGYGKLNMYEAISRLVVTTGGLEMTENSERSFWHNNPVTEKLVVFSSEPLEQQPLEIYDLTGRLVPVRPFYEAESEGFYRFSLKDLEKGHYLGLLKLTNGHVKTIKIARTE